ncbi:hypothetical protein JKF63_07772 [Porcisia hertigi]|uniref:Uncharacterized protein n=1 Tax=Porcisia hertigi TaxID=2761500 RepID=A0A836LLW6_9TRYP|nr:hypothetical protein JKF63_07772 [Porcisia hertigi]
MSSRDGCEASAAAEGEEASSTRPGARMPSRLDRDDVDFSNVAVAEAAAVPPARAECLPEHELTLIPHTQPDPTRDPRLPFAPATPKVELEKTCDDLDDSPAAPAASSSTGREELIDSDCDLESGDLCSLPESETAAWLLDSTGVPPTTVEAVQQDPPCSPTSTEVKTLEAPLSLVTSNEKCPAMELLAESRLSVASSSSSPPREPSSARHSDDGNDMTSAAAALVERVRKQEQTGCGNAVVTMPSIVDPNETGEVVEDSGEQVVWQAATMPIASPAVVVTASARPASQPNSSWCLSSQYPCVEDAATERAVTPDSALCSSVEALEDEVKQAPWARASPESSAVLGGSPEGRDADSAMSGTDTLEDVISTADGDCAIERKVECVDPYSATNFDGPLTSVAADAATRSEEVVEEAAQDEQPAPLLPPPQQQQQHKTSIPHAAGAMATENSPVGCYLPSDPMLAPVSAPHTEAPAVPLAAMKGGGHLSRDISSPESRLNDIIDNAEPQRGDGVADGTARGATRARRTISVTATPPLSAVHTANVWRSPPQPSPQNSMRHHRNELCDVEPQRTTRLSSPRNANEHARGNLTVWQPRSLAYGDSGDDRPVRQQATPPAAAPLSGPTAVDVVGRFVMEQRRIIADAPLRELVELEREGRSAVTLNMLQGRETLLQKEAVAFSVLSLVPLRAPEVNAAAATSRREGGGNLAAAPRRTRVPPLPPSPLSPAAPALPSRSSAASVLATLTTPPAMSFEKVERQLQTRRLSGSVSLDIVSAALFADELLKRDVVETAEVSARTMLQRLCQCDADALNPSSILVQETLARQRLEAMQKLDHQRTRLLNISPVAEALELLNIGRELALCCVEEDNSRREVIEKAEHLGRMRLRELHWRGLAARLRQRELLQASMDVALRSAIEDTVFDETQEREELRVEAIREMTALLESRSGTVVRNHAHRRHCQRQQQQQKEQESAGGVAQPQSHPEGAKSTHQSGGAGDRVVTEPTAAKENRAPPGDDDDDSCCELVEEVVSDLESGVDAGVSEAVEQPMKSATSQTVSSAFTLSSATTSASFSPSISATRLHQHMEVAATVTGAATAATSPALVLDDTPAFFEWNPTSNSASSHSTRWNALKAHAESSSQQEQQQQQQPTWTSSPSPHWTNLTTLTTTVTGDTTSSGPASSGGSAPHTKQRSLDIQLSINTTPDNRRSLTTVLPTEEEQQQLLKGHERVNAAEVSALLHALQCTKATVRNRHLASRRAELAVREGSTAQDGDDDSHAMSAENRDGCVAQGPSKLPRPLSRTRQHQVNDADKEIDTSHRPRRRSHSRHVSATRPERPLMTRHTIPCSLRSSPLRSYAALMLKYSPQREPGATSRLLPAEAASVSSPTPLSMSSPRPYADGDVYAYDPQHTRHSGPARWATFKTHHDDGAPWEASPLNDIGNEEGVGRAEAMPDSHAGNCICTPSSAGESMLLTAAPEAFPARCHRTPSHVPSAATLPFDPAPATASTHSRQPLVLEVITDRRMTQSSVAADVTVSTMSSSTGVSETPTRTRPTHAYATPTAAWIRHVQQQKIVRCVKTGGSADGGGGGSEGTLHASSEASPTNVDVARHVNVDQYSCSRRRWGHAEGHTAHHVGASPAPLLITRLPLERGPGVWMSSPRNTHSGVHLVATTSPPRARPAPKTLAEAFSLAARRGEVVHLPTTVAELLHVPQHTHLSCASPAAVAVSPLRRPSEKAVGDRHALRQRTTPYNYVDVFYKDGIKSQSRGAAVRRDEIRANVSDSFEYPHCRSQPARAPSAASDMLHESYGWWRGGGDEEETPPDPLVDSDERYFDDDSSAFLARLAAITTGGGRHRTVERCFHQQRQARRGAT